MHNNDHNHLGLDWIAVSKKRLYTFAFASAAVALAAAAAFYLPRLLSARAVPTAPAAAAAQVYMAEGEVTVYRASDRRPSRVTSGSALAPGDTLQTSGAGVARLTLADGSELTVAPDSLVTLAENAASPGRSATTVGLAVNSGSLSLTTAAVGPESTSTVRTPNATSRLSSQTSASFSVMEDHTEQLRVRAGQVSTVTRTGQAATLRQGEFLAIDHAGSVAAHELLLRAPLPTEPADRFSTPAPPLTLRWANPPDSPPVAAFEVQVALSPFFTPDGTLLDRRALEFPHLILMNLRTGPHFWRVRAFSPSGQPGEWSDPRRFTVQPQTRPPTPAARAPR